MQEKKVADTFCARGAVEPDDQKYWNPFLSFGNQQENKNMLESTFVCNDKKHKERVTKLCQQIIHIDFVGIQNLTDMLCSTSVTEYSHMMEMYTVYCHISLSHL